MEPGSDDATEAAAESEEDWKFSVAEVSPEAQADGSPDQDEGNVAGSLTEGGPVEPGDIDPENAVFVLLGIGITIWLVLSLIGMI